MEYFLGYMLIGVLAGVLAGLLGVGGGAVTVPLLLYIFARQGVDEAIATHMALATSLAAMVVTSISSTLAHSAKNAVLWPVFLYLTLGVILGTLLGVGSAVKIDGATLQILFSVFIAYVSLQMIVGFSAKVGRELPGQAGLVGAGSVIGCVSMYFGIGGGSLTVPFLSYCGVSPAKAVGTSAALGLPIAFWGAVLYILNGWQNPLLPEYALGFVYGPAAIGIILTSAVSAKLGAGLAHKLKPQQLRKVFGFVLLVIAMEMLWTNLV